jgi:hypothetical protein
MEHIQICKTLLLNLQTLLIEVLKYVNVQYSTRKRIIEDLNKNFPKLIGNIDLQSASTEDLVSLQRQSNEQFEKQIRLQVANEILADQLKEIAQAEKELIELRLSSANSFEILRQGSGKNVQENDRLNQKIEEQKEKLESLRDVYKETNGQLLQQGILVTENNEGQTIAIEQTGTLSKTFEELKPRLISQEDAENLFIFQGELEQAGIKAEESSESF